MKAKSFALPAFFVGLVLMCVAAYADPITDALAGKTLVADNAEIKLGKNGALTGKVGPNKDIDLVGAWTIRDGRWCRTLSKPESAAGTACQDLTLGDGVVTIDGRNGPVTYDIR